MGLTEKVIEARQRTLGSEHPNTLISNLANYYRDLGRRQEATELAEKVLEARQGYWEVNTLVLSIPWTLSHVPTAS